MIVILTILLLPAVTANSINVHLVSMSPETVTPGNLISVIFEATNTGSTAATDLRFVLHAPADFTLETDREIKISEIDAGEQATLSWLLKADDTAQAGFDKIELTIKQEGDDASIFVPIQVRSLTPTLSLTSVITNPEQIAPGQRADVEITLKNEADFKLKSVKISLDLASTAFAPIQQSDEQTLSQILPGRTQKLIFMLTALPEAPAGIYKIPMKIEYFDEFGNDYETSNVIALKIGSVPSLEINEDTSLLLLGQKGETRLKIVNTGLIKVKVLTVSIETINTNLLSPANIYIGDLDIDDFQTIDLNLYPQSKDAAVLVQLSYKDANNEEYRDSVRVPLKVYDQEEAKQLGLVKDGNPVIYVAIIIVLVIGFFFWRRRKKKKAQAQQRLQA